MKISADNRDQFKKDFSFNPEMIDDPYVIAAYISDKNTLDIHTENSSLADCIELIHPVALVAARTLKYFSTNNEGFNLFRARRMSVWLLRHIYNSFNWWSSYVVSAEGERKNWPMLYIGENFGSAKGSKVREADIVISAFENDSCIINATSKWGAIFAAGYSNRDGLFNSPDMYCTKLISAKKYKGSGISLTNGITKNLLLMSEHLQKSENKEPSSYRSYALIKQMRVIILDRPHHKQLIKTIDSLGAKVILAKDDDLSPTLSVVREDIDLMIGVGGVPEAVLSALIVENLGGEMSIRLLPASVAKDEKLLRNFKNWDSFRKEEIDVLKNFKITRPGTEKRDEIPWDKIWNSSDLARGNDMVFTASIIKKTPWIKYPDGRRVPGVTIDPDTGDVTVHVVHIRKDKLEIIPLIYKTVIKKYKEEYEREKDEIKCLITLVQLAYVYTEFGLFRNAKECIQTIRKQQYINNGFLLKSDAIYEYITGVELLTIKTGLTKESIINHFEEADRLSGLTKGGPKPAKMIKRYYEYLGDTHILDQKHDKAMEYYKKALKYSPHELKIYRKLNSLEMMDMFASYFSKINDLYRDFNYRDPDDWISCKLKVALEVFYNSSANNYFSCKNPWLIFFRKTVLLSDPPSYQMAILVALLKLHNKLNNANDEELIQFLDKEFRISKTDVDIILNARVKKRKFDCVSEVYFIKGLTIDCITQLLYPNVKVASHNELEDSHIPLSITTVDAMERRASNILEELREGYKEDAQEHQYSLAESYHYLGLVFYDMGNIDGTKIYYSKALGHFKALVNRFKGLTPVNAQHRMADLFYELGLLFPEERIIYYKKSIDSYMNIIDDSKFIDTFGDIRVLALTIRHEALKMVENIENELQTHSF